MRSAVTTRPVQSGMAAMTCSMDGIVMPASGQELELHRLGQPCLEALLPPPPAREEEMEEHGINEHPKELRRSFLAQPVTKGRAFGEKIAHDVPRADAA